LQDGEQKNLKKHNSSNYSYDDNLKVYIRVRPPLMNEKESSLPFRSIASVSDDKSTISLIEYLGFEFEEALKQKELIDNPSHFLPHPYTFDHIFDMDSTQDDVYQIAAVPAVESLMSGYNSTIFAYGQTGTGKTYTMEGFSYKHSSPKKGLIPRAIENIFKYIENNSNSDTTFIIRVTYLQIYNESIDDLLKSEKKHLSIRESHKKGIYVEGLSEWAVCSPNDIYALLERGAQSRTKAQTKMNDVSSRSHAVFTIILEQMKNYKGKKQFKSGKLNLVDLAGSERVKLSGATGKQLDESRRINKSLSALGNVINALTDPKTKHIPYRDSKLTRLLQNSLGGNCKTSMIAMISPYDGSFNESISTLNFAKRAKSIRIKASINEELNQNALISQYENELNRLRKELEEKNQLINNNEFIKKIEMEKIQAEKDKNEALQALEKASFRFLQEREEKIKLEKKLEIMKFQMIQGGQKIKIEDTPEFKTLLQKHQILLQKDFNEKLNDLEKEKELMQISKEQVDSYNDLLNKQKETMESLTNNLKEKEENINHLNEMIDSYEKIINEQDNIIEIKNQRIKLLENILIGIIINSKSILL
jgi:kinesin family protein 3/17